MHRARITGAACGLAMALTAYGQCDPLWSRPGPISSRYAFGQGVHTIGDFTGDAVPDLVAIDMDDDGYWYSGKLLSGADGEYLGRILPSWEERWEIAPIGDSDGDGVSEWVASGIYSFVSHYEGGTLVQEFEAPDVSLSFGLSLCSTPDWDGDGVDDVLASDYDYRVNGVPHTGRVLLFSTATGEVLHTIEGAEDETLAKDISRVGDIDMDGVDDIAISGYRLYLHSGADLSRLYAVTIGDFGYAVKALPVGDVDDDGAADFVATFTQGVGAAYLISGADGTTLQSVLGAADHAITAAGSAGDWDRDGVPDVAVGARDADFAGVNAGRVTVLSGSDLHTLARMDGPAPGDRLGSALDAIQIPGDDYPTLAIGALGYDNSLGIVRALPGRCPADFNCDGAANTLDVLAFLNAWNAGDFAADTNFDNEVDTLDVLTFLNLWAQGC
ncbi:MAG: hypothetical protein IT431_00520 [Phycisphaerales bacterium]|nr:hypothetical protein [Phycisphaerales bacterium]